MEVSTSVAVRKKKKTEAKSDTKSSDAGPGPPPSFEETEAQGDVQETEEEKQLMDRLANLEFEDDAENISESNRDVDEIDVYAQKYEKMPLLKEEDKQEGEAADGSLPPPPPMPMGELRPAPGMPSMVAELKNKLAQKQEDETTSPPVERKSLLGERTASTDSALQDAHVPDADAIDDDVIGMERKAEEEDIPIDKEARVEKKLQEAEELQKLYEREEKAEIAREIIYEDILPRVLSQATTPALPVIVEALPLQEPNEVHGTPIVVEVKPYVPGDSNVVPIAVQPVIVSVAPAAAHFEQKDVNVEQQSAVEEVATPLFEVKEDAKPETKSQAETKAGIVTSAATVTATSTATLNEPEALNQSPMQKHTQIHAKLQDIMVGSQSVLKGGYGSMSVLSVAGEAVEYPKIEREESEMMKLVQQPHVIQEEPQLDIIEEIVASPSLFSKASVLVSGLKPLTSVLDWIEKDEKLRLESDLVALSMMKIFEQTELEMAKKFAEDSRVDKKSRFYRLIKSYYVATKRVGGHEAVLEKREELFESQLDKMWPRETKKQTQTKVGPNNQKEVKHTFEWEHTWTSETDAKQLMKTLGAESGVLLPELTRQRYTMRHNFLKVELYLFSIQQHQFHHISLYPTPDSKEATRMERVRQCADVIFYFLRRVNEEDNFQFVATCNKWVKILNTWVYTEGSDADQEYLFRHMIRTRGLKQNNHAPQFPVRVDAWNTSISKHFLTLMYLLLSPIVSAETKSPQNDGLSTGATPIISRDPSYAADILTKQGTSSQALSEVASDVKEMDKQGRRSVTAWKAALSEDDLIHLLRMMPIKEFLNHIFSQAFNSAAAFSTGWKTDVDKAIGTAKAVLYMIATALNTLPEYTRFHEELCKVSCWTMQSLVDSYATVKEMFDKTRDKNQGLGELECELKVLVTQEIDWICARSAAVINSLQHQACRKYLQYLPLKQLSASGASLIFQIIFRNLVHEDLLDSGYRIAPLSFKDWQTAQAYSPVIRKNFFAAFAVAAAQPNPPLPKEPKPEPDDSDAKLPSHETKQLRTKPDKEGSLAALQALTTLSEEQPCGSPIPKIWIRELFLAGFVDPTTSGALRTHVQPLVHTVSTKHPEAVSQFLADLSENFFERPAATPELQAELKNAILQLNLNLYKTDAKDADILRRFLETRSHFCFGLALIILDRYNYPSPTVFLGRYAGKDHKVGGKGEDSETLKLRQRLVAVSQILLPMLGEVRLAHLARPNKGRRKDIQRLSLDWWCKVLCRIETHDLDGTPLAPNKPSHFPSQECVDRLEALGLKTFKQLVGSDPVLTYINLMTIKSGHQLESFKARNWNAVQFLLHQGEPCSKLGYKALCSLIPALAKQAKAAAEIKADLKEEVAIIDGILQEERRRRSSKTGPEIVRSLIWTHLASLTIRETLALKAEHKHARWNVLFEAQVTPQPQQQGPATATATATAASASEADAKNEGGGLLLINEPQSHVLAKQAAKKAAMVSEPVSSSVVEFWISQIALKSLKGAGLTPSTGTNGKGWLADPTSRYLMDQAILALYRLQPINRNHKLKELTSFFRTYVDTHAKTHHKNGGIGLEPTPNPLGSRSEANAAYGWLCFQILTELTERDEQKWKELGVMCVKQSAPKTPWKKVVKSIAPNNDKVILWESCIREWARHALFIKPEHPLTPVYWQKFFGLFFSRLPASDTTVPLDQLNPGRFYGFRYLGGNSGQALLLKIANRLRYVGKWYGSQGEQQMAALFLAMHQWVSIKPREAPREILRWGTPYAEGLSPLEQKLLQTPCPKAFDDACCWRVNQLALRARIGGLPPDMQSDRLISVIADEGVDRTRQTLWLDLSYLGEDFKAIGSELHDFIPAKVFGSVFSTDVTGDSKLDAIVKSKRESISHHKKLDTLRAQTSRNMWGDSKSSFEAMGHFSLVLPVNLRVPVRDSLGNEYIAEISQAMEKACKSYSERLSRLQALAMQTKQLVRGLYINVKRTSEVPRIAKGGLFKSDDPVTFTFNHTEIKKATAVDRTLKDARKATIGTLQESPEHEIFIGHDRQVQDICSQVVHLQAIADYLIHTLDQLKNIVSPRFDASGASVESDLKMAANRWLRAVVAMEGPVTEKYPVTKDHLIPIVSRLARFVPTDLKSQMALLASLHEHPNLVPQLAAAVKPMELYHKMIIYGDEKMMPHGSHADYVNLFLQACHLRVIIKEEQTKFVSVKLLERFQIDQWLSEAQPEVHVVVTLLNHASAVLAEQYQHPLPKGVDIKVLARYDRTQKLALEYLIQTIAKCARYEFPKAFDSAWTILLEGATAAPFHLPPQLWSAVGESPLARLKWSQLLANITQLGSHVDTLVFSQEVDEGKNRSRIKPYAPTVYQLSGGCAREMLKFAKSLVVAGLRKLHFVRSAATGPNSEVTPQQLEQTLLANMRDLWKAVWAAFRPWLVQEAKHGYDLRSAGINTVNKVCDKFAEVVALLLLPDIILPQTSRTGADKITLWHPSQSIQEFLYIYAENLAPGAQPQMLTFIHAALRRPDIDVISPQAPKCPLPFHSFTLKQRNCVEFSQLLVSFWQQGTLTKEKAAYRVQEVVEFTINFLANCDWSRNLVVNAEQKADSKVGKSSYAVSLLALVCHCCLVSPTPYPGRFPEMLQDILCRNWHAMSSYDYEQFLIVTSDLLYKKPHHNFQNTLTSQRASSIPQPQPPQHTRNTSLQATAPSAISDTATNTLRTAKSSVMSGLETRDSGATPTSFSDPTLPPRFSGSDTKAPAAAQNPGASSRRPVPTPPPAFSQNNTTMNTVNSNHNPSNPKPPAETGTGTSNPTTLNPSVEPYMVQPPDRKFDTLKPAAAEAGGLRGGGSKGSKGRIGQLAQIRIEEEEKTGDAAEALGGNNAQSKSKEWLPLYRRDRGAFVLRLAMAMALPYPSEPFRFSVKATRTSLDKTRLYTEWLLSVFHNDGPEPVTADVSWYLQLAKQVLTHLNTNAKKLLDMAPRTQLIAILREFSMAARAAESRELTRLSETLTTQYPNLAYEVITSFCQSAESSPVEVIAKIEACITTALNCADIVNKSNTVRQAASAAGRGTHTPPRVQRYESRANGVGDQEQPQRLIGNRTFGWKLVADALEIKIGDISRDFFKKCAEKGCLFAMCGVAVRRMAGVLPLAFDEQKVQVGGEGAVEGLHEFDAAIDSISMVADNLREATVVRVERCAGDVSKVRELEYAIATAVRLVLSAQVSVLKHAKGKADVEQKAFYRGGKNFAVLAHYIRKGYQEGKFGSSKMQRIGGKISKFFGSKSLEGELTPRFRLLARALYTFIALREDEGSPSKYSWNASTLMPTKTQQAGLKHFQSQVKAKPFRYLTRQIEEISAKLERSSLTLLDVDTFYTELVALLFPGLPWPADWYSPDSIEGDALSPRLR